MGPTVRVIIFHHGLELLFSLLFAFAVACCRRFIAAVGKQLFGLLF
jgi:hypothetical protein